MNHLPYGMPHMHMLSTGFLMISHAYMLTYLASALLKLPYLSIIYYVSRAAVPRQNIIICIYCHVVQCTVRQKHSYDAL